jgi:hypothetical protein
MVRPNNDEIEPHETKPGAPAGAEGASSFGHRLPAGEDVLGEAERPDQRKRMDRDERTAGVKPPGPVTAEGERKRAASRRLAKKKAHRKTPEQTR